MPREQKLTLIMDRKILFTACLAGCFSLALAGCSNDPNGGAGFQIIPNSSVGASSQNSGTGLGYSSGDSALEGHWDYECFPDEDSPSRYIEGSFEFEPSSNVAGRLRADVRTFATSDCSGEPIARESHIGVGTYRLGKRLTLQDGMSAQELDYSFESVFDYAHEPLDIQEAIVESDIVSTNGTVLYLGAEVDSGRPTALDYEHPLYLGGAANPGQYDAGLPHGGSDTSTAPVSTYNPNPGSGSASTSGSVDVRGFWESDCGAADQSGQSSVLAFEFQPVDRVSGRAFLDYRVYPTINCSGEPLGNQSVVIGATYKLGRRVTSTGGLSVQELDMTLYAQANYNGQSETLSTPIPVEDIVYRQGNDLYLGTDNGASRPNAIDFNSPFHLGR